MIPVPIEEIVEFNFKIDIIPIPGLMSIDDIDGFISGDLSRISVDAIMYEHYLNRYRFTLAHELAHLVLHQKFFKAANFTKIGPWKRFVEKLDTNTYRWLEWQSHCFAGLVLVPPDPLEKKLGEAIRRAEKYGVSVHDKDDSAKQHICRWVAKRFDVSEPVVEKRIQYDQLWPPPNR